MQEVKRNPPSSRKGHWLRTTIIVIAVLLILAVCAYALRAPILTGVADYLVVSDDLQPADLIFVLNSEVNTRPFYASELYKQGLAPLIVIARSEDTPTVELGLIPNDTDIDLGVMKKLGVPDEKIVILQMPGGVTSTICSTPAT